jgi:hypothetical protein
MIIAKKKEKIGFYLIMFHKIAATDFFQFLLKHN